jgi:hypothetical protein
LCYNNFDELLVVNYNEMTFNILIQYIFPLIEKDNELMQKFWLFFSPCIKIIIIFLHTIRPNVDHVAFSVGGEGQRSYCYPLVRSGGGEMQQQPARWVTSSQLPWQPSASAATATKEARGV